MLGLHGTRWSAAVMLAIGCGADPAQPSGDDDTGAPQSTGGDDDGGPGGSDTDAPDDDGTAGSEGGSGSGGSDTGSPGELLCADWADGMNTTCADGSCADTELLQRTYDAWLTALAAEAAVSEDELASHMVIVGVTLMDGPVNVFVDIDYYVVADWLWVRGDRGTVNLGAYPLDGDPTDDEIAMAVQLAVTPLWGDQVIDAIAEASDMQAAADACAEGAPVELDWCHTRYLNQTGELVVQGVLPTADDPETCWNVSVDVVTAEAIMCFTQACAMD